DPIEINLTTAKSESELDVPVRPGDTIIVPAAGEVMVDGWVRNPGAFHIMAGMTAVSAVSAAGGSLFSDAAEVPGAVSIGPQHLRGFGGGRFFVQRRSGGAADRY